METSQRHPGSPEADWVQSEQGAFRWQCRRDWEDLLLGPDKPTWQHLSDWPGAARMKQSFRRSVWRVPLGEETVVAKVYVCTGWVDRLKHRLRGGEAHREWLHTRQVADVGICTIEPVAVGAGPSATILISREIAPVEKLENLFPLWFESCASSSSAGRQGAVLRAMAEVVGRLHKAGLSHPDLHLGNFLLSTAPNELHLTDLQAISGKRRLSRRRRAAELGCLMGALEERTTDAQRRELLSRYLDETDDSGESEWWYQAVQKTRRRNQRRIWSSRDRRAVKNSRYFARLRRGPWRGMVYLTAKKPAPASLACTMTFSLDQWQSVLSDPQAWLDAPGGETVKDSAGSRVVKRMLRIGDCELTVYCKQQRRRRWYREWLGGLISSRSRSAWRKGWSLIARGVPTVVPLAYLEHRRGAKLQDEWLITEAVEAPTLREVMKHDVGPGALRSILKALAETVALLEKRGYDHRDLKESNLLIWSPPFRKKPIPILVDLDGLSGSRCGAPMGALGRLSRAAMDWPIITRTDRLRFLKHYLSASGRQGMGWKPWWRRIARRTGGLKNRTFHNILLIKPSALGDVIHAIPTLSALRKRFPDAKITWLLAPAGAELLTGHPMLDEIIVFQRRRLGQAWWNIAAVADLCRFLLTLRRGRFDLVLDVQGLFRTGFFAWTTGAKTRVGLSDAREMSDRFYTHVVKVPAGPTHAVDRYLLACRFLGCQDGAVEFPLPERPEQKTAIEQQGPYAVVVPGGSRDYKRWRVDGFAAVCEVLCRRHFRVILAGTQSEKPLTAEIQSLCKNPLVDLAGQTSPSQLTELIRGSGFFLGNDSAPLHLAAALGVPCVGLYGATDPKKTGPYGLGDCVVQPADPADRVSPSWMRHVSNEQVIVRLPSGAIISPRES